MTPEEFLAGVTSRAENARGVQRPAREVSNKEMWEAWLLLPDVDRLVGFARAVLGMCGEGTASFHPICGATSFVRVDDLRAAAVEHLGETP